MDLLLSPNKENRNLQYNCHAAKIVCNNGKRRDQKNLKISKFRVLIIIYRAFLLEADVLHIGLNRFYLSFKKREGFQAV